MYRLENITRGNTKESRGKISLKHRLTAFICPDSHRLKTEDFKDEMLRLYNDVIVFSCEIYQDPDLGEWLKKIPIYITGPDSLIAHENSDAAAYADNKYNFIVINQEDFNSFSTMGFIKILAHELNHLVSTRRYRDKEKERVGTLIKEKNGEQRGWGFGWLEEAQSEIMARKVFLQLDISNDSVLNNGDVYFNYEDQVDLYLYLISKLESSGYPDAEQRLYQSRLSGNWKWFYLALDRTFGYGASREILFDIPVSSHFDVNSVIDRLERYKYENTRD